MTTNKLNGLLSDKSDPATELAKTQRALLKLAFALRGQDSELDQVLVKLTNLLRSGMRSADITQIIDEVIATFEKVKRTGIAPALEMSRELALVITDTVAANAPKSVSDSLREDRAAIAKASDRQKLQAVAVGIAERVARSANSDTQHADKALPTTPLIDLLAQLQLPESMHAQSRNVQEQLMRQPPPPTLEATRAVAKLLTAGYAGSEAELQRMSAYLQQVIVKVAHLQQQLHQVNNASSESLLESEAFNRTMHGHVRDIQLSVDSANDINDLKTSLAGNLQSLNAGVDQFVTSSRQRHVRTEELLTRLNTQLNTLEGEAKRLSDGLVVEREKSATDPLTGIANRRSFDSHIAGLSGNSRTLNTDICVAVIDIDHFKSINDRFGHQAGDRVLKGVAEILRGQLRAEDFIARYGGEEFVVVLPGSSLEQAFTVCERMRAAIEACTFRSREEIVPVTISLGVAELSGKEAAETAIERADRAMYEAKSKGRNQTVRAVPPAARTPASAVA
ncbi:MAG: GGDEF domain-containing protein [Gammaproteobacteria bacterium]